uniref:Uncharacterized protein n=1 Tax=Syphacia muris TaxID=451379 RepID=A0A0N5AYH2_9BILA
MTYRKTSIINLVFFVRSRTLNQERNSANVFGLTYLLQSAEYTCLDMYSAAGRDSARNDFIKVLGSENKMIDNLDKWVPHLCLAVLERVKNKMACTSITR